jgi:hypothetical protein
MPAPAAGESAADKIGRFGPTATGPSAIQRTEPFEDANLLAPGGRIARNARWIGLAFAATAVVLRRRDLV